MKKPKQIKPTKKRKSKVSSKKKSKKIYKNSVVEIQRHWFGLFTLQFLISLGGLISWSYILAFGGFWQDNKALVILISLFLIVLILILFIFIKKVYKANYLIINKLEVRQIKKEALFSTKLSTLGLANIEDVTIVRKGIFAHMFNYGTLNIETAGEQENFKFRYCPNPVEFERKLMDLREDYLKETNSDQVLR